MPANLSINSLETVLDLAVWLEKHGQEFYESAACTAVAPASRELFTRLAREERKHCVVYTDLYESLSGKNAAEEELLGEYGNFIRLLIREITRSLEFLDDLTQEELIGRALQFEKNTLLYFMEIERLFSGKAKAVIAAICSEEKRHIQLLLELRENLRNGA